MTSEIQKFSQFSERLIELAHSILSEANITMTDKGLADPKVLATTLLIRNISNLKGITTLVEANLILEARILLRCCYENLLWVGKLSTDGDKFVKEMRDNEVRTKKALGEYVMGQFPSISKETKEKLLDNLRKFKKYGDGLKVLHIKKVAKNNIVEASYLAYSQLSADVAHPSLTALTRGISYYEENGIKHANVDVSPIYGLAEIISTISAACDVFIGVCVGVNEILGYTPSGQKLMNIMEEYALMSKAELEQP